MPSSPPPPDREPQRSRFHAVGSKKWQNRMLAPVALPTPWIGPSSTEITRTTSSPVFSTAQNRVTHLKERVI